MYFKLNESKTFITKLWNFGPIHVRHIPTVAIRYARGRINRMSRLIRLRVDTSYQPMHARLLEIREMASHVLMLKLISIAGQ